jgi:putative membrane protein
MPGGGESMREEEALPLGPAATEIILDHEDFHCPAVPTGGSCWLTMKHPLINLLVRWSVLALGVALAAKIVSGISYKDGTTLLVVVLLLSFFNAILKPLLVLFTLPFIVLTLGIGVLIINALLFLWVGKLVDGFHVANFWSALWGALIVSITNMVLNSLFRSSRPRTSAPVPKSKRDDVIDI